MVAARRILVIASFLFLLGVVVQFFLAGLGTLGKEQEDMDLHRAFGFSALFLSPIFLLLFAYLAKASRSTMMLALALVIVSLVQPFWVSEFRGELLGAMHILGALVIFVLAHHVAQRALHETRSTSDTGG